jgi:hypothetical protein
MRYALRASQIEILYYIYMNIIVVSVRAATVSNFEHNIFHSQLIVRLNCYIYMDVIKIGVNFWQNIVFVAFNCLA